MLLIPIGAEEDGSRAKPVVTLALIALNVLWFLVVYLSPGGSSWQTEAEAARTDLEQYWSEHPNLTPPESLVKVLGPERIDALLDDVREAAGNRRPATSWLDELHRQELDRRAQRYLDALANRPAEKYGFVPARPSVFGAVMSLFMHSGFVHLAGNMLFLWATAPFVEAAIGGGAFLALYLAGGFAALLTHWLAAGPTHVPLVGASGAIAAVMGALLVGNAGARIRFFFLPILWLPRFRFVFGVPAFVVLPLWFGEQVISAHIEPDAPVAWWAHIGGFVFGMAVIGGVRLRAASARPAAPARPVRRPRPAEREPMSPNPGARPKVRVAVVSTGAPGGLVITSGTAQVMRRTLDAADPGALALDETVELDAGPADLRVELRLLGGAPRVASVLAVLKKGESRVLRIEPRPSGLSADLR